MQPVTVRFGIAAHLAAGFLAVAVLAVAANLLVQHGPALIRTRLVTVPDDTARGLPTPSAQDERDRTARLELAARAGALSASVARFALATRDRADRPGEARDAELRLAAAALDKAERAHALAADQAGADGAELLHKLAALRDASVAVVAGADAARTARNRYRQVFSRLEKRLNQSLEGAWTIFGRVVARQVLVDLRRAVDAMRPEVTALAVHGDPARDAQTLANVAAGEDAIRRLVAAGDRSLRRAEGAAWLAATHQDLAELAALRQDLGAAAADAGTGLDGFLRAERTVARHLAAESLGTGPAAAGAGDPAVPRGPATRRRPPAQVSTYTVPGPARMAATLMPWLTGATLLLLLLISVATVTRIVGPVHRLVAATRRLADGDTDVEVPRGGIREMDLLAEAFNGMAERLAAAQELARQHHAELESRVRERTRQLQHLADHDPLTQLPNRRWLVARLNQQLAAAGPGNVVGVYFLDFDNFKNINDSMGHVFGDRVLQAIAGRIRSVCPEPGFAARMGGDEFTMVLPGVPGGAEIRERGDALVRAFLEPLEVDGRRLTISASAGAAVYPDHAADAEGLLRAADAALFHAKAAGRSRLGLFSPGLLEQASIRFTTEQALRRALENDEFELLFQPEIRACNGEVAVVEALLRWRQPDGQLASPEDFLAVAEDSGLINPISAWVVEAAVGAAATWHRAGMAPLRVAVNVSSRQLLDQDIHGLLLGLLDRHQLPAHCIELELTENVLQTSPRTIETLQHLRRAGFGIALDDFGTGYSSLVSLEQLPLTRVKLDRALVAGIDTSARCLGIARAIIGLCESLDLEITAEGIERQSQLLPLLTHRRMHVQGFLLSPPVPAAAIPGLRTQLARGWGTLTGVATPGRRPRGAAAA